MSEGNKVGRPLKFKSVEELQEKIDKYFKDQDRKEKPYTITGLALALDTNRRTLINYEDKNDEYFHTIKKAKNRCAEFAEEFLFAGKSVVGSIFNLKNNYGWVDKQEIVQTDKPNLTEEEVDKRLQELMDKLK